MTSLLDILKEVDFRVDFTDSFKSLTGQQRMPQTELQKRLLLCLFGLGTNTGLTSVSMGDHGVSYDNLKYVRRRFISKEAFRQAISQVVNATLEIKQPTSGAKQQPGAPLIPNSLAPGTRTCERNGINGIDKLE